MTPKPILDVRNLTVAYSLNGVKKTVVREVNFEVPEGGWVCLVGESGCGKSQTALSLTQLLSGAQISGQAHWKDSDGAVRDLLKYSPLLLRALRGASISYIFQNPDQALNPVLKIGKQMTDTYLAHFKSAYSEAKKSSLVSLVEAHLSEPMKIYDSYPYELSGGMKQRVMIAMALMTGPRLIIADEPTTALDVRLEKGIIDLLADIRHEWRLSYFYITHHISLACRVADRIYVMKDGEIVERMDRAPDGFLPKRDYTKKLFNAGLEHAVPKSTLEVDACFP